MLKNSKLIPRTFPPNKSLFRRQRVGFVFIFLFSFTSFSQEISRDSLKKSVEGSLNYLAQKQKKETVLNTHFAGEWEAFMRMKIPFVMLGGKKSYEDSNCFTMAGIHNILAEMYLADTGKKEILPMLKKVFPEVMTYGTFSRKNGWEFNFWKPLPSIEDPNILKRRPTNFRLRTKFIQNAANVANDADDTAMGNLAIWYQAQIFGEKDSLLLIKHHVFDNFVDKNRKNRNWYNHLFHGFSNSGAYMTWLAKEAEYSDWNFWQTFEQNMIFFHPNSVCFPHSNRPYIPWGSNDIDAVVNANVLTFLSKTKQLSDSKAKNKANQFIENHAKRGRWNKTTVYYPNRYHFHYAVSRALAAGDFGLKLTGELLLKDLLITQKNDGSFESIKRVNKHDILQSTAYAFLTMMYLHEAGIDVPKTLINKTLYFLEKQKKIANQQVWWKGGVFFSGGTIVRSMLYFTSDAYTTALISLGYQKYLKD